MSSSTNTPCLRARSRAAIEEGARSMRLPIGRTVGRLLLATASLPLPHLRMIDEEPDAALAMRRSSMRPVPLVSARDEDADGQPGGPGRVLLIYTGGTMGMTMQNGSLTPLKGYLPQCIRQMPEVRDPSMPALDILEYEPLIDSSNVGPDDWKSLASHVRDNYYDYDGFVIVHGTDTMAYTASALSFMLEGLGKAVVLTGSMIPLAAVYNDARRNLLISMIFAAQLELCEVHIHAHASTYMHMHAHNMHAHTHEHLHLPSWSRSSSRCTCTPAHACTYPDLRATCTLTEAARAHVTYACTHKCYLHAYTHAYTHADSYMLLACIHTCLLACIHTCLLACLCSCTCTN